MKLNELAIIGVAATTIVSCTPAKTEYACLLYTSDAADE